MAAFGENEGPNLRYWFRYPKGSSLRGTASFDVFCVKIGARVGDSLSQEPPPPPKIAESLCAEGGEITHAQNRNP